MADCTERIIILTVQAVDVLEVSLVGSWGAQSLYTFGTAPVLQPRCTLPVICM